MPVSSNTNNNSNINIINDNNSDDGNGNNKEMTENVEHETYDLTAIIDATGIVTKGFKKKFGSHARGTFSGYTTKNSDTSNVVQIRKVLQFAI